VTRAKICGITRREDAELAVELGAWAIGLIRWEGSARACPPAAAAEIVAALRRQVACVGVFVNPTLDELAHEAEEIPYSHLQLHGDEGPAFCAEAARVANAGDIRDVERFHTDFHLLDTAAPGLRGGTGRTWEWGLLDARHSRIPLILSGGLGPDNVGEAIAAADPWAVDSASGTEREPGIKDPDKVRRFLEVAAGAGAPA